MKPFKTDVAVLLLFFTRTAHTKYTFAQICKARPSKLFLYQDGPREGRQDDIKNIQECRKMVESMIDWDCEIHRLYQPKNIGCDPSEYISQKWMFSFVDRGIIIEDDDVMSESFFPFCKELLDKYADDKRIYMISGQNHLGKYEADGADYFFSKSYAIWGWATWKRTIDSWDPKYNFLKNKYTMNCLEAVHGHSTWKNFTNICKKHLSTNKEHYETIGLSSQFVNSQLNIVPSKNMTCNIGIGSETTHSASKITLQSRGIRKVFFQKTYEIDFPLKHPEYIVEDIRYEKLVKKINQGNFLTRLLKIRFIESRIYRFFPFLGCIGSLKDLKRVSKYF